MILPAFYTTDRIFVPTLRILFYIKENSRRRALSLFPHFVPEVCFSSEFTRALFQPANLRGVLIIDGANKLRRDPLASIPGLDSRPPPFRARFNYGHAVKRNKPERVANVYRMRII